MIAFSKRIINTDTLSVDPLIRAFLITFSEAFYTNLSIVTADIETPSFASLLKVFHIIHPISFSSITSKIPSLAISKKLCYSLSILKCLISGSAMTTLGFPPNYCNLHSISPKAQLIASHPGITQRGACGSSSL